MDEQQVSKKDWNRVDKMKLYNGAAVLSAEDKVVLYWLIKSL